MQKFHNKKSVVYSLERMWNDFFPSKMEKSVSLPFLLFSKCKFKIADSAANQN